MGIFANLAEQALLFDWTVSVLTVISSVLLAWGVYKKSRLEKVHKIFIGTLASLAVAHFFRSLVWMFDENIFYTFSYFGFVLVPLFLTLFIEEATHKATALWFKVYLLLQGLVILYGIFNPENFESAYWKSSFAFYHSITFIYLATKSYYASFSAKNRREAGIFRAIGFCIVMGLVFGAVDWSSRFGWVNVKLSSIPTLMLIYFLTAIFFSQGAFRMKRHMAKLAVYLIFPITSFVCMKLFIKDLDSNIAMQIASIGYLFFVPVNILCQVSGVSSDGDNNGFIKRINALPQRDLLSYLEALQDWAEITKVHLVSADFLRKNDLLDMAYSESDRELVLSKKLIAEELADPETSFEDRKKLEAADFILRYTDCDFLCVLGDTGNLFVAKFSNLMDVSYYQSIMSLVSRQLTQLILELQFAQMKKTPEIKNIRREENMLC